MKVFKRIKWSYVVLSAMFLLLGIYLVANPETSLIMICRILGAALPRQVRHFLDGNVILPGPAGKLLFHQVSGDPAEIGGQRRLSPVIPRMPDGLVEGLLGHLLRQIRIPGEGEHIAVHKLRVFPVRPVKIRHALPPFLLICAGTRPVRYSHSKKYFLKKQLPLVSLRTPPTSASPLPQQKHPRCADAHRGCFVYF